MDLTRGDRLRLDILHGLRREKQLTMNALRMKVGVVNLVSLQRAINFLERLGLVETERRPIGRREYVWVRLTDLGKTVARRR